MKTHRIDNHSRATRLAIWVAISLVAIAALAVVEALVGDSLAWSEATGFWFILAAAGYWGSEYRNHRARRFSPGVSD